MTSIGRCGTRRFPSISARGFTTSPASRRAGFRFGRTRSPISATSPARRSFISNVISAWTLCPGRGFGAQVTGLDFSAPAIEAAATLAREIGIDARFVAADVYDAPQALGGAVFDIVYTGVGALCWLPDMTRWARVVSDLLRPGGELYLYEFHPLKWIFGETETPEIIDSYFTPAEGFPLGGVTYADSSAGKTPTVQWNHPLGEVVTALVAAGLRIQSLRELDGDVLRQWPAMVRGEDRLYRMPPGQPALPLMYVLRACREA